MSTTTIFLFEAPSWEAKVHAELHNSWGFAPFVWDSLLARYHDKVPAVDLKRSGGWPMSLRENWEKLWLCELDFPFEPWEKTVLHATYDRAVIHVGQFAQVAACLRKFERMYFCPALDGDCHLSSIACVLDELLKSIGRLPNGQAVGFQATSVAQDLWRFYNEETGESVPYNLKSHALHHMIQLPR